ncbi:hypothetical protein N0V82_003598 [Gnomoniopsis sp. IMI 355080]|nr:hypothetical protein N0V82_003598 [Gnomoniopsis sp. IMI 355080]
MAQRRFDMVAIIEKWEQLKNYEWQDDQSRRAIFLLSEEYDEILTRIEAEGKGKGKEGELTGAWKSDEELALIYGPAIDEARNAVFDEFMDRNLGLHDVSRFYMDWSIDQKLWQRLIQAKNGLEQLDFPWPAVRGFSVPASWQAYFSEEMKLRKEMAVTSKAIRNTKDPLMTNAEFDRMVDATGKDKEAYMMPKVQVQDSVKGKVELSVETDEQREERVHLGAVEMKGVVDRVDKMEKLQQGTTGVAAEDEAEKTRTVLVFTGCEAYELPLEQHLASLVPPRDVHWINCRLPYVLLMLREELPQGRIKLVFKAKPPHSLGGGRGGSTSDMLDLTWSRVLRWKYRMVAGEHQVSLRNTLLENGRQDTMAVWKSVEEVFPCLQTKWNEDQAYDASVMDAEWFNTLRYGMANALDSMDPMSSHSIVDKVRVAIDWVLASEDLKGSVALRCWGALEVLGSGGREWKVKVITELNRRSIPAPREMATGVVPPKN